MEQLPTIGTASDFPSYHSQGLYFDANPGQRETMWWGCVQAIADVHALDWRSLRLNKLLMPQRGARPLEQVVKYCDELLTWGSPDSKRHELVDAVKWLRDSIYEPEHLVLCWGDSRLSNILYGQEFEVTAVLDWELAYIGDHEADLAWLLFVDWACSEYRGRAQAGRDAEPGRNHRSLRAIVWPRGAQPALQRSARGRRARHPGLAAGNQAA